jgi:hypothetical protein
MSQFTLDLPESLRQQLTVQAKREGVSLEHYILYSLTRLVTASDLEVQKIAFEDLTGRYPEDQAEAALRDLLSSRQPPS